MNRSKPSRRHLLRSSALAASTAVLGPAILRGADEAPSKKLNVAFVGPGGRGKSLLKEYLVHGDNIVAFCDVDEKSAGEAKKQAGEKGTKAKLYTDYRKLLDADKNLDAVVIATPDHWHYPLCKAFIEAGKHVYCEKPLTRTLGEAKALRDLAKSHPNVITQTGNQGSAQASLRRSVELIKAGVLGQITEMHAWLPAAGWTHGVNRPAGEDPIPAGLNWDFWIGPSPARPYKAKIYHPGAWRGWYDFGSGSLGDFTCHAFNLPLRALDLGYAHKIEVRADNLGKESYATNVELKMHFAARGALKPLVIHWYDGGSMPDKRVTDPISAVYQKLPTNGCMFIGDKGVLHTNIWNNGCLIKLSDDPKLKDVLHHEPTKGIAQTLPRTKNHMYEWVAACKGEGKVYSPFEFGTHLTEIGLAGVLALRVGRTMQWNGSTQTSPDAPESAKYVNAQYRKEYLL